MGFEKNEIATYETRQMLLHRVLLLHLLSGDPNGRERAGNASKASRQPSRTSVRRKSSERQETGNEGRQHRGSQQL